MEDLTEFCNFLSKFEFPSNGCYNLVINTSDTLGFINLGRVCVYGVCVYDMVVEGFDFGICRVADGIVYIISDNKWFKVKNGTILSAFDAVKPKIYEIHLTNPKPANISDIHLPNKVIKEYYLSLCEIPKQRKLEKDDIVTFVDSEMNNPPIIIPKWAVLKYCSSKFANNNIFYVSIVTDQEVADFIMNAFEHHEKPKLNNKLQLIMYKKMYNFLVTGNVE